MIARCLALATVSLAPAVCQAGSDNYNRAVATFDAVMECYGDERLPLFRETYPFDDQLKVTYLSNEEQADQQKRYSYLWPFSGSLSAVAAIWDARLDPRFGQVLEQQVRPGLEMYFDSVRTPAAYSSYLNTAPASDRFYDDNIWIGLDFTDLYRLTRDPRYLEQAKLVWRFIESGIDDQLGYGIYWCEQKKNGKNTCSNAPGSVYAAKLYLVTGDSSYLRTAVRLYEWTRTNLQDSTDGLYFDNKSLDGTIGRAKFAYNSGQMMQASAFLYRLTGEEHYLREARRLAAACYEHFFAAPSQPGRRYRVFTPGNVWFTAIMVRGFIELYGIDYDRRYIDAIQENLDQAWTNGMREENGLFNDNWTGQTRNESKWLLTQFAMAEMYARLALIDAEE